MGVREIGGNFRNPAFESGFTALFLKREEEPNQTTLDFYMSFLEVFLEGLPNQIYAIRSWIIMKLHEEGKLRDVSMLGRELWRAAAYVLSSKVLFEAKSEARNITDCGPLQQIRELFEQRELFGIRVKQLYGFLLYRALDGGCLAEMIISQEPACFGLDFSDDSEMVHYNNHWLGYADVFLSLMLHREIHPDTQYEECEAELLDAIMGRGIDLLRLLVKRLLLKHACDINHRTSEGLTLLTACITHPPKMRILETLKLLLDAGCEANYQDDAGRTPLMIAIYLKMYQYLELLFNAGCNASLQDTGGGAPLRESVSDYVPRYLEHRMDLWEQRFVPIGGYTALMYAVLLGDVDMVELLLKYPCDTKLTNSQ